MSQNISKLFTTIQKHGKIITLKEPDPKIGVAHTDCSTFIRRKQLLVRGERNNPKPNSRKALLVFCDPESAEIKGTRGKYFL